jgi:signal transduction histidine kinase
MRERALLVGATLTIESSSGHGTTVKLVVPVQRQT